uniref:Single-pass membrane and coiled-coil domain-containing protein 4 isoform X3 n=1 Tax=Phascolarctos cinereus TaxID=38626 RepID=A0A6P5LE97_PHACI|nr:single-pass membrane and coiled-coil domain-containing protein 4 isoform X3 [Phascolarctos cinereus]
MAPLWIHKRMVSTIQEPSHAGLEFTYMGTQAHFQPIKKHPNCVMNWTLTFLVPHHWRSSGEGWMTSRVLENRFSLSASRSPSCCCCPQLQQSRTSEGLVRATRGV